MFSIGSKVRCTIKGRTGGVVIWSNSHNTCILVGATENVYANELLQTMDSFAPKFSRGQLVRHIHRASTRGYVFRCCKEKTTIMMRAGWEDSLAVFYTDQLEPAKAKKSKKKKPLAKEKSSILNSNPEILSLPAIFVDATMGWEQGQARIVAILIGAYGEQLYYAIEDVMCKNNNGAEKEAIQLGIDIRTNDAWPIYSDSATQAGQFPDSNVIWIPRTKNRIADKLLRVHA